MTTDRHRREAPGTDGGFPADLARVLADNREALRALEGSVLAGVAESLALAADGLMGVLERIEAATPQDWLTPERAALYVGYGWDPDDPKAKALAVDAWRRLAQEEGVPVHRLSAKRKLYNRREIDDWLLGR